MADVKDAISAPLAGRLAGELVTAWPAFPRRRFTRGLREALTPLALMARLDLLRDRLVETMPTDFDTSASVLRHALQSPGFTGWMTVPCGSYVARAGIDRPEVALPLLAGLTPRWSSEWSLRPFIEAHPDIAYTHLHRWASDPDEHVRRLVSEGTRPRLPWASQLRSLIADPTPAIGLLDKLVDDPSEYVRRSVANHLNDIAKDHPDIALDCARRWLDTGGDGAAWMVRHGLRTMVKHGHPAALGLLGFDHAAPIRLDGLTSTPARLPIGGETTIEFTLSADHTVRVAVDYLVHHAGARAPRRPKVFKLTTNTVHPGRPLMITRRHPFREVTVRRLYPGTHRIDIQVNGRVLGGVDVELIESGRGRVPGALDKMGQHGVFGLDAF
jgi:3-methyladenine DNA glycosylase AlkC